MSHPHQSGLTTVTPQAFKALLSARVYPALQASGFALRWQLEGVTQAGLFRDAETRPLDADGQDPAAGTQALLPGIVTLKFFLFPQGTADPARGRLFASLRWFTRPGNRMKNLFQIYANTQEDVLGGWADWAALTLSQELPLADPSLCLASGPCAPLPGPQDDGDSSLSALRDVVEAVPLASLVIDLFASFGEPVGQLLTR